MCFEGYYACIFYDKEDLIKALNLKKKRMSVSNKFGTK